MVLHRHLILLTVTGPIELMVVCIQFLRFLAKEKYPLVDGRVRWWWVVIKDRGDFDLSEFPALNPCFKGCSCAAVEKRLRVGVRNSELKLTISVAVNTYVQVYHNINNEYRKMYPFDVGKTKL